VPVAVRSALGPLRLLLAGSLLVPLLLFVVAGWLSWREVEQDTRADLARTSEVAREHAEKIFDSQSHVAERVTDRVRGMDLPTIRRAEKTLHDAFQSIVAPLPQVYGVLLVGRDGHPLVTSRLYPVNPRLDLSGFDYFRGALQGHGGTYVSGLQVGAINNLLFFGLSWPWIDEVGQLAGVIDIAVAPDFFEDFYKILVGEAAGGPVGNVVTLVRDDGMVLVRYPPFAGPSPQAPREGPFFAAVGVHPEAGSYDGRSVVDNGAPERLYDYRKVPGYPLYVVAGRSRSAMVAQWRRDLGGHLLFGLPIALALVAVTWLALLRSRAEQQALARARAEIARREHAEATLLRAQRLEAVGQMTGGVAHDFNNMLTVILGTAELLALRADQPDRVRRMAEQIMRTARHGAKVTQQLLTFARRQTVRPELVDVSAVLDDVRPLLARAAGDAIELAFNLAAVAAAVRVDPGHFEAAILNLVGNARDAMAAGGVVVIHTRYVQLAAGEQGELPPGRYVGIAVADTGSGMDAATAARAVEPFFTTKEVGKGSGLGLSQVFGFARQAGGDVRIVTAPGEGAVVEILLPAATGSVAPRPVAALVPEVARASGEVVLVVEDDAILRQTTSAILRELGYAILEADSAPAALALLAEGRHVDLVFSDMMMPGGMNGAQLAAAARGLRPGVKLLLTSGYAAGVDGAQMAGVALLPKPYDRAQLASRLQDVLRD
jgi:two-component system NtrC family sensor kinase